jgi:hypothetical protein
VAAGLLLDAAQMSVDGVDADAARPRMILQAHAGLQCFRQQHLGLGQLQYVAQNSRPGGVAA